ncbi:MAG TPA: molybdopterin cofactor-binding domain-containing protein [Bradyrhizobium sp.]|nr:molybdopterin cofactor-binding domain-containing protein [Bradyrhizobium sp.]
MIELQDRTAIDVPTLSRRSFLIGVAGAGVAFGFAPAECLAAASSPVTSRFDPTIWYSIDRDGLVTVNVIRAEMGQHVGTALARILADELEADWSKVRIDAVDTDPKWGLMVTGGSWSVWMTFPIFSRAGAAGRIALVEAGAKLLGVPVDQCQARNGSVVAADGSISYGEIVSHGLTRTFTEDELARMPIKPAAERRLIGRNTAALDIPAKTNGTTRYGIDAAVEGMVYARPKIPPTRYGARVRSIDDSAAEKVKGFLGTLALEDASDTVPGWVMVLASSYPAAIRAADLVKVEWTAGEGAKVSERDVLDHGAAQIADPNGGVLVVDDPDIDGAFRGASSVLERSYTTGSVLHCQLEPVNALAFEKDGIFEIHTGNQWQSLILPVLSKALGMPQERIVMRTYALGGGFGRRLNGDYAVPAALAAKALRKPVKMVLTRPDDMRFDSFRSPSIQTLRMAFGDGGKVVAMDHHASAGWPTVVMAQGFMAKGLYGKTYDPFAIAGADHWYDVGAHRVRALPNDVANTAFRPGWLRSVGPGWTNWAVESFMDEAAHTLGVDPLEFRLRMLDGAGRNAGSSPNAVGGAKRQATVLRRAAQKAGWGVAMPKDTGLGIAATFGQERGMPTWTACVARVRVGRSNGVVSVEKLTIVIDAGTIVDPDGALAQVEGGALWGLSMALREGTEFVNGQVKDTNLDTYTPLRIGEVPELDIEFIDSMEVPVGLGEPATTVVAPAIGNAIFAAVGVRLRHLPIRSDAVRRSMTQKS